MDIHALARQRAAAALVVQNLGVMNSAVDYEERLKQDAAYQLAKDALARTEDEYRAALSRLSQAELSALVQG